MKTKPKLLVYAVAWNEQRNLLFSRYLTDYFEVIIITSLNITEKISNNIKPVKVITTKFFLTKK